MQMKDKLGPEKPIQMSAAGKGVRSSWYRVSMVGAAAAIAGWWYWTREEEKKLQSAATERFGKHGEKAEYGRSFGDTVNNPNHFPGSIPTAAGSATTNTGKPRGDI
ncbi:hypothetical protein Ndes2526A_g02045 [Nannochloris sp. 'desiccata']